MQPAVKKITVFQSYVKNIGYKPSLGGYEKRKLGIFNLMNVVGLLAGIAIPIAILIFHHDRMPVYAWFVACSPALISLLVLTLIHYQQYETGRMLCFTMYPVMTAVVYGTHVDMGIEFFFVLYGVLSVFFLQRIYNIIFCFTLSMTCYFAVNTFWNNYVYRLEETHYYFFVLNHILALFFIFYGLLMIKTENSRFQQQSHEKNFQLRRSNLKILRHKADIAEKAALLQEQTHQLTELNTLKNKLTSSDATEININEKEVCLLEKSE